MPVRSSFTAGEVLTAADLTDTFASKLDSTAYQPGLVKITDVSFTTASSVIVNNVFTATYRTYRVVFDFTASVNDSVQVRMRVSGTTTSGGTAYSYGRAFVSTGAPANNGGSSGTSFGVFANTTTNSKGTVGSWDVFRPQLAARTLWTGTSTYSDLAEFAGITHDVATSYDGFELTMPSGNMTGVLRVYGYRD